MEINGNFRSNNYINFISEIKEENQSSTNHLLLSKNDLLKKILKIKSLKIICDYINSPLSFPNISRQKGLRLSTTEILS